MVVSCRFSLEPIQWTNHVVRWCSQLYRLYISMDHQFGQFGAFPAATCISWWHQFEDDPIFTQILCIHLTYILDDLFMIFHIIPISPYIINHQLSINIPHIYLFITMKCCVFDRISSPKKSRCRGLTGASYLGRRCSNWISCDKSTWSWLLGEYWWIMVDN